MAAVIYFLAFAPPIVLTLGIKFFIHQLKAARTAPGAGANSTPFIVLAAFILGSLLAATITIAIWLSLNRRSKQFIQRINYRLCPRCRYDLTASPPDGACPECGRSYTEADLRSIWRRAYRLDKFKPFNHPLLSKPITFRRSPRD